MVYIYSSNKPNIQEKFINTLEVIVKKKSSQKITVDSQWLSEKEMRDELNWSACLVYMKLHVSSLYVNICHVQMQCSSHKLVYKNVQHDLSLWLTNLH